MIEVVNQQRKVKIKTAAFQAFAEKAIRLVAEGKSAAVAFVSDAKMTEINRDFRGKNSTTDVLSFQYEPDEFETDGGFLGDIVISLEQAKRQAAANGLTFPKEVKQLILHGLLHLAGYDHEKDDGEMNEIELKYRDELNIS